MQNFAASEELVQMVDQAHHASDLLKALAHESRLTILCILAEGEKSVSDLEVLLEQRQSSVSQQLARLRLAGWFHPPRRQVDLLHSPMTTCATILNALYEAFCHKPLIRRE